MKTCPRCRGSKTIPNYFSLAGGEPCPDCKGRGVIGESKNIISSRVIYRIQIHADRSLDQMIRAGKYDSVHPDFRSSQFDAVKPTPGPHKVTLIRFGLELTSQDTLQMIIDSYHKPANIWHLLALGEQYPKLQMKKKPIVALGSTCQNGHFKGCYPILSSNTLVRIPRLLDLDGGYDPKGTWKAHAHFLAVK